MGVMRFEKGHPKLGGRAKGTPNKATLFKRRIFDIVANRDPEVEKMKISDLVYVASKFVPKEIKTDPLIDQSQHTYFQFEYKQINEDRIRATQSTDDGLELPGKVESPRSGQEIRKDLISGTRANEEGTSKT